MEKRIATEEEIKINNIINIERNAKTRRIKKNNSRSA
jgi:hypothetical protein